MLLLPTYLPSSHTPTPERIAAAICNRTNEGGPEKHKDGIPKKMVSQVSVSLSWVTSQNHELTKCQYP